MGNYTFTHDWTGPFLENAPALFSGLVGQPVKYLEVGIFEARSAVWMLDNVLTHPDSRYVGVDINVQPNGWKNFQSHLAKATVIEGDSKVVVPTLRDKFDVIYVDGDHSARGALFDSVAVWRVCKKGGIILWDDYRMMGVSEHDVLLGVNSFIACLPDRMYKVLIDNYQFAVEKLTE